MITGVSHRLLSVPSSRLLQVVFVGIALDFVVSDPVKFSHPCSFGTYRVYIISSDHAWITDAIVALSGPI